MYIVCIETLTKILSIMKKIILVAALLLGFAAAVAAQPRAVGVRFGYGVEATYQHTVGSANFVEANLGLNDFTILNVAATYNWMLPSHSGQTEVNGVYMPAQVQL